MRFDCICLGFAQIEWCFFTGRFRFAIAWILNLKSKTLERDFFLLETLQQTAYLCNNVGLQNQVHLPICSRMQCTEGGVPTLLRCTLMLTGRFLPKNSEDVYSFKSFWMPRKCLRGIQVHSGKRSLCFYMSILFVIPAARDDVIQSLFHAGDIHALIFVFNLYLSFSLRFLTIWPPDYFPHWLGQHL